MEKDILLENEITEKKKATPKKKVASSSKDDAKSTAKKTTKKATAAKEDTKKTTAKKSTTKKATAAKDGAKKTTTKKATASKTTSKKTSDTKVKKETVTKKTAAKKVNKENELSKEIESKNSLESLLNKKIVVDESDEINEVKNNDEVLEKESVEDKNISENEVSETKKFELPKKNTDAVKSGTPIDAQEIDHVAILKKKMEAQKKLKENMLDEAQPSKPSIKFEVENNVDIINDEIQQKNEELSNEVESLKLENKKLKAEMSDKVETLKQENEMLKSNMFGEVETLKNENEKLKSEISGLMADINDKEEKLIILTNSIVNKSTENELAKEVEILRKENKDLQDKIEMINDNNPEEIEESKNDELTQVDDEVKDNEDALTFDVIDKGELSFRIKLLNERIAEKDNQIKLVEEELNNLTEKDIIAEGFASEIKTIRKLRKESIAQANLDLNELAKLVKSSEAKLIEKQEAYSVKCDEIKSFDEKLKSKKLSYTEKEVELNARSILYAAKDSLFVEIESHEENYKKLLNRYKVRLEKAESSLEKLNSAEADLLNRYLSQLREDKSNNNEDYQMQLMERNALYEELNKLKKEMEVTYTNEDKISFEQFDINALKADLAKYSGKLVLISEKYTEREKIEKVLLKNEQSIKDYCDAFKNRETVLFNINENNLRIKSLEVKLSNENDDIKKELLKGKIESINIIVTDDKEKANYYNSIIEKSRDDEKVAFYIKLINSMIELKDKEKEYTIKVENIKANIAKLEEE